MVCETFLRATPSVKAVFRAAPHWRGDSDGGTSTESWISRMRVVRFSQPVASAMGVSEPKRSTAALTAPHELWPMTTTSFAPAQRHAYSMLPRTLSFATLPATRTMKASPRPRSKTSSTGARESMQLRTTAMGYWPDAVAPTCRL